jgi:Ca2+-binding RTX toxin-like protein
MATLHAIGGTIDVDMRSFANNLVNHAAQSVPTNASEYSWTSTSGNLIHAFSFDDDITFNGVAPLGGTVHALQVVNSFVVGGMVGNLVSMTTAPNAETFWRPILSADTTLFASSTADFAGMGDFVNIVAGENLTGGDDVFEGAAITGGGATFQTFYGDGDFVQVSGRLTGGKDLINARAHGQISGDANLVAGRLDGGADEIIVDHPLLAQGFSTITGDVFTVSDLEQSVASFINGGHDEIFVLGLTSGVITGDIFSVNAVLGTSTGGNDLIDASANPFGTEIYGDVVDLNNHMVRGGKDTIIGSAFDSNFISGDAGDVFDRLLAGADTITGGEANDELFGDFTSEGFGSSITINGTFTGDDKIYGAGGSDEIYGQVGDDVLDGGMGDDFLIGGSQTAGTGDIVAFNTLNVAVSVDLVMGFAFGQGIDFLSEFESIRGSNKGDSLAGDGLANRIEGLDGNDQIFGRGGNDTLLGGKNNDVIKGGLGNDTINGGANADTMEGNGGVDTFQYSQVSDSGTVAASRDLINGFTLGGGGDKIDVSAIDAQAGTGGNQAFTFIGNAAFSAEGQIRFDVIAGHTIIEINTTGVSGAEMGIDLAGALPGLTAASFVL